jgi:hypothetical protein
MEILDINALPLFGGIVTAGSAAELSSDRQRHAGDPKTH